MPLPNACPLCAASRDFQSVETKHVYGDTQGTHAFFHCNACDVRYQYPRLTTEEEVRFYNAEFEGYMESRSGTQGGWQEASKHIIANESTRQRRMKYLAGNLNPESKILEIGCSSGFMLYPLQKAGHSCYGIEPSGIFSSYVRKSGIDVYSSLNDIANCPPTELFDVIIHFFVLEHIADPLLFLRMQIDLLKPGGRIIFEIPNVADPLHSVYDIPAFEYFYWSIAHHWYFSKSSLDYVCNQLSLPFEIVGDQRYDLSNHMIWARDGKAGGMGRFTDVLTTELEEAYKQVLIKIGRCDTLVCIIKKE